MNVKQFVLFALLSLTTVGCVGQPGLPGGSLPLLLRIGLIVLGLIVLLMVLRGRDRTLRDSHRETARQQRAAWTNDEDEIDVDIEIEIVEDDDE